MVSSKRRSKRISSHISMSWLRQDREVTVVASEINEHGLFIRFEGEIPALGELLQLVIELPDGPLRAHATARVVNDQIEGPGVGAEIVVLSDHERRRWAKHYRQLLISSVSPSPPLRSASGH
jgi:hypothetical protein